MIHFAKLNKINDTYIVVLVIEGRDEDDGKEDELTTRTGDIYKQTSYNTRRGTHFDPATGNPSFDQSKAFRKNYAAIGYIYDAERDAFMTPKPPYISWILNETTAIWEAPIPYPTDGKSYRWDENTVSWVLRGDENTVSWVRHGDENTVSWVLQETIY